MTERKDIPTRNAFGDEIVKLGEEDSRIVVIDCDIAKSCKTTEFSKRLPNQHLNVGIAEQNACGIAAGLATCGKIPFVSTYAVFGSLRMNEQIRQSVCYPNLNVKIACSHGGVTPANDGASHQAIEDIGALRSIPNIRIIMPADYISARNLIRQAAEVYGPVYLRFTRDAIPQIYSEDDTFEIGKAKRVREGQDVVICANGDTVSIALRAAEMLSESGINVGVYDFHTIKPLDTDTLQKIFSECGKIITVEDHNIIGGLGSAICEAAATTGNVKVSRIGIQDRFGESAPYKNLLKKNGITAESIAEECRKLADN